MESIFNENRIGIAKSDDSLRIWEIRNHPAVRKYSGDLEEILFVRHDDWFKKKYINDNNNHCFVLKNKNKSVIGYCRFDYRSDSDSYTISIALDPEYHGRGLGHFLLSRSLQIFKKDKNIFAEIRKENIVSVKLFEKNNFKIYSENGKKHYLKLITKK